jgi:hypothetical protein
VLLKNLVIGPDNKLYVDMASSTNADPIDVFSFLFAMQQTV